MAADDDEFVGLFAADQIADDVEGASFTDQSDVKHELQLDRLAERDEAIELIGIWIAEGRGGHPRLHDEAAVGQCLRALAHVWVECDLPHVHAATGVRKAVAVGTDGADQHCGRALASGEFGALAAYRDDLAVAAAITSALHRLRHEHDLAAHRCVRCSLEFVQRRETHDLGLDAALRRAGRKAECQQRQFLRGRRQHLGAFRPPAPHRKHHRFQRHPVEAERLEPRFGPAHGARVRFGARHARADLGGQGFDDGVRAAALEGVVAQLRGGGKHRFGKGRGWHRRLSASQDGDQAHRNTQAHRELRQRSDQSARATPVRSGAFVMPRTRLVTRSRCGTPGRRPRGRASRSTVAPDRRPRRHRASRSLPRARRAR